MAKMMKAAVLHRFNEPLVIVDLPVPEPAAGQILVRISASGVCHTDLHTAEGDWPVKPALPLIPGHEGAGFVEAVGAGVTNVRVGDCVGIPWLHSACGQCDYCKAGWETLCPNQSTTGYSRNGTFAEYTLADPDYVARIPEGADLAEMAPILCAGVTVYNGLKRTEAKAGDWVAIAGVGGLGHLAVQYAVLMGFKVAAIDVDDAKLDLARRLGASLLVNSRECEPGPLLKKETGGMHGVLVAATALKAYEQAFAAIRPGGTMTMIGLPAGSMKLPIYDTVINAITVRGSVVGTPKILREAIALAGRGRIRAEVHREKLENINAVLDRLRQGRFEGRFVIEFDGPKLAYDRRVVSPQSWA